MQFFTRQQVLIDSYVLRQKLSSAPKLYPISPNPFQSETLVEFSLPGPQPVQLRVLNALGQEVAVLHQGATTAGWHKVRWARSNLAAGLYYVQLQGNGFTQVVKAELI
ncbi:MAG: T9SS type A sorting domain-containing protein [Hymenobacter sp.]|nr:MAG: T9SS type A sorting domain-containing protein [Hymenobacter sp.]